MGSPFAMYSSAVSYNGEHWLSSIHQSATQYVQPYLQTPWRIIMKLWSNVHYIDTWDRTHVPTILVQGQCHIYMSSTCRELWLGAYFDSICYHVKRLQFVLRDFTGHMTPPPWYWLDSNSQLLGRHRITYTTEAPHVSYITSYLSVTRARAELW